MHSSALPVSSVPMALLSLSMPHAVQPMRLFDVDVLNLVASLICFYRLFASFSLFLVNGMRPSSCSRTFCSSRVDVHLRGLLRKNHDDTAKEQQQKKR